MDTGQTLIPIYDPMQLKKVHVMVHRTVTIYTLFSFFRFWIVLRDVLRVKIRIQVHMRPIWGRLQCLWLCCNRCYFLINTCERVRFWSILHNRFRFTNEKCQYKARQSKLHVYVSVCVAVWLSVCLATTSEVPHSCNCVSFTFFHSFTFFK